MTNFYCNFAQSVAENSFQKIKHGAVVVYKRQIISYASNDEREHAEISAILKIPPRDHEKMKRFYKKCIIIVVRRTLNNSKPCKHCLEVLKEYGIKKVYYSMNKDIVAEKTNKMENNHVSSRRRNNYWKY